MHLMKVISYIIHLDRAAGRRGNVRTLQQRLCTPTSVIPAIDGERLTAEILDKHVRRQVHWPRYPFLLSRNEVACFLSHRSVWSAIVEDGVDAGLVLEDDATTTPDFRGAYDFALSVLHQGSFIRFPHRQDKETGTTLARNGSYQLLEPYPVGLGMVAQLVTREAAIRLLTATDQFDRPVDTFAQMYWITGVRPLSIRPSGIMEISKDLGGSTIKHDKSLPDKIVREVLRPIYRKKIQYLSA